MTTLRHSFRAGGRGAHRRDRGAAAVEMALILPVLLFVLMGLIDFGRAYNTQIQLSQAAREGARFEALGFDNGTVDTHVNAAASSISPTVDWAHSTTCPAAGGSAVIKVEAHFQWITGISALSHFFGPGTFPTPSGDKITSEGVMRCLG
ncbi:TadE family protein [Oryzihumus leptocrescens]|uniref:TadE-like protein n=1 Tax=Oryzihumus leptocrescens TaxID=297536 RepID=A0A542ZGG3_9MICO|nr:TadE family protein [Oryzihumus leptocrescens]TQL59425.1 TadE-like protein [Oryzihumus leptocrescens]